MCATSSGSVRPRRRRPTNGVPDRIVEDPVARCPFATPQRPDPTTCLGQVDQAEVEGEGPDHGLGRPQVQAAQVVVEPRPLGRVVVAAKRDRPTPDPLDETKQLGTGLLGDHLAEQRPEQTHLDRERVAGARGPDAARFGRDRRRRMVARARTGSRDAPSSTVPGPSRHRVATFPAGNLP